MPMLAVTVRSNGMRSARSLARTASASSDVVSGATIAVLLVKASDAAARWLAGRPGSDGQTDLSRAGREFSNWVDYVTSTSGATTAVHPVYNPGSLTAILICLMLVLAIVVALFALLMRTIALLMLIITLPLTLAGSAGTRSTT